MKELLWSALQLLFWLYLTFGLLLYIFQRDFIYYPRPKIDHHYTVKTFVNDGINIDVIVVNEGREKALIYFGGNAESVAFEALRLQMLLPEFAVYLVNYRGYGGSAGKPTEEGLYSDAVFIYDQIKYDHSGISAMGRSLGSGVAIYLAAQRTIDQLILVSPFDSIESVAQKLYPFYPMTLFLKDKYLSAHYAKNMSVKKILVVIAENDRVIKPVHSYSLIKSLPADSYDVQVIIGKGHNDMSGDMRYYDALRSFLGKIAQ